MKKITFLLLHLNYGGLEKQTITLINELAKENKYEIEVLSVYDMLNGKSFYPIDESVKVRFIAKNFGPHHQVFKDALKNKKIFTIIKEGMVMIKCGIYKSSVLRKYIKKLDTDVIISSRIEFSKQIKRNDTLNISQEHSYITTDKYISRIKKWFKNVDDIVVMTNKAKREYEAWIKESNSKAKVLNIPNMIEDKVDQRIASFESKNIISVGRLEAEKDFPTLVEVFNLMHKEDDTLKLRIIGEGSQREVIENKIKELGLDDSVTLTGKVDFDTLNNEFANAKIFILSSLGESFSLVLCEAMDFAVPCLSFNIDVGPKEIIQSGENGILVENRNIELMAKEALELINNQEKWNYISNNCSQTVKQYYSSNVVKTWMDIIDNGGKK